jgi:hypothetical protein
MRRLVLASDGDRGGYDRRDDDHPQYRCTACSDRKLHELQAVKRVSPRLSSPAAAPVAH